MGKHRFILNTHYVAKGFGSPLQLNELNELRCSNGHKYIKHPDIDAASTRICERMGHC